MKKKKYSFEDCGISVEDCGEIKSFCVKSICANKTKETIDFFGERLKIGLSFAGTDTSFATFALWLADVQEKLAACCNAVGAVAAAGNANIANQETQIEVLEEIRDLERSEVTSMGCYQLIADNTIRGELVAVYNEDKTFDRYDLHTAAGVQVVAIADVEKCVDEVIDESCKTFVFDIKDNETVCFTEIVAKLAAAGITTTVNDIVGFDFDLKPLRGDAIGGYKATTSQATSTGGQGDRDLDGGGSFKVNPTQKINGAFNRLSNQCFTAAAGSVAVLSINYI